MKKENKKLLLYFIFAFLIRIIFFDSDVLLRVDAFAYMMKAIEITNGNFVPYVSQPIGWSLLLSIFLKIFSFFSLTAKMLLIKVISILVNSAIVFPLYQLTKRVSPKLKDLTILLFIFYPNQVIFSQSGYSESFFIFIFLYSLDFFIQQKNIIKNTFISVVLVLLLQFIRPYGLIVFEILFLLTFFLKFRIKKRISIIILIVILFLGLNGITNNNFVTYDNNYLASSKDAFLFDYTLDETKKDGSVCVIENAKMMLFDMFTGKDAESDIFFLFPVILPFLFIGIFNINEIKFKWVLIIPVFIFMINLIIVMNFMEHSDVLRHLFSIIPILLILTSHGVFCLKNKIIRKCSIGIILIAFIFALIFHQFPVDSYEPKWAKDMSKLEGTIAIIDGGEFIIQYHDDIIVDPNYILHMYNEKIELFRPREYKNIDDAIIEFEKLGVDYIIVDNSFSYKRPYFQDFNNKNFPVIYSDNVSEWKIQVYKIS